MFEIYWSNNNRSAYRLCVQELLDTSHLKMHGEWKLIWKIQCPPRVKNLLWRICRRCIPTRASLQQKGVNCTTNCALCNTMLKIAIMCSSIVQAVGMYGVCVAFIL
jgi:hypothetical protein